jgi:hypothetical protein
MQFELALKSHIPIIGVTTDDLPNFEAVLKAISGLTIKAVEKTIPVHFAGTNLYWTDNLDYVTVDVYNKLMKDKAQMVVLNPDKKSTLIFDAGILPTPEKMVMDYLKEVVPEEQVPGIYKALKGLSLKATGEIVMMTQARTGATLLNDVRRTRAMFGGSVQGLYPVDTDYDFYEMPDEIESWLNLNKDYFLNENIPFQLRPRGIMLEGFPGVGKSMGAKAIAKFFDIPLYRLDIATTMNRYIGETEARIARSLALIEKESPCVLLIDEVEKVFSEKDDAGVTSRILSQLLWWLADHQSQVITVMTTNKLSAIPPELYRQGRIDLVVTINRMNELEAYAFAYKVYQSLFGKLPSGDHRQDIRKYVAKYESAGGESFYSHAEVAESVYSCIKEFGWYKGFDKPNVA